MQSNTKCTSQNKSPSNTPSEQRKIIEIHLRVFNAICKKYFKQSEQNYTNLQASSHSETPRGQVTILRVIPTTTCQNAMLTSTSLYICPGRVVIRFYVSFISFSSFLPPLPPLLVASFTATKCEGLIYKFFNGTVALSTSRPTCANVHARNHVRRLPAHLWQFLF